MLKAKQGIETEWQRRIKENDKNLALLYEMFDEARINWRREIEEHQAEMSDRLEKMNRKIDQRLQREQTKREESGFRSEIRKVLNDRDERTGSARRWHVQAEKESILEIESVK